MNQATAMPMQSPPEGSMAAAQSLREWLGVLVLSTGILRRHGQDLCEQDRLTQREIMHEAATRLTAALALAS